MKPQQVDDWHRLYGESWKGAIDDDSFAHPAKFSRALIRAIYDHALGEAWLCPGATVLDPFGGVALGALNAMEYGLNYVGVELEERFVLMGNRNIQRWKAVLRARGNGCGSGYLYHGDSRYLSLLLGRRANGCISSPPYEGDCAHTGGDDPHPEHIQGGTYHGVGIQGAVSSPPYAQSVNQSDGANDSAARRERQAAAGVDISQPVNVGGPNSVMNQPQVYGTSPAQLGAMRAGSFEAAVSSPPYNLPMSQDHSGRGGGERGTTPSEPGAFARYGNSPGQLEGLPMKGFEAAVSSPPYAGIRQDGGGIAKAGKGGSGAYSTEAPDIWHTQRDQKNLGNLREPKGDFEACVSSPPYEGSLTQGNDAEDYDYTAYGGGGQLAHSQRYGTDLGQLGAERGETFWAAARQVLDQTYQVLAPGAHAIFVCKDFVRHGERVPFSHQWAQLCVAVGFEWLHEHRAWVVEDYGTQLGFFEDKPIVKKRMSFFRRLAEKNGAPPIHYESVMCFRKN